MIQTFFSIHFLVCILDFLHYSARHAISPALVDIVYQKNLIAFVLNLRFDFTCYYFRASIEGGYEWLWINKGIDKITSYDVAFAGDTLDDLEDFTLHGPYIGILATF